MGAEKKLCCVMHKQIRDKAQTFIKTLHGLGMGRTPRQVNMIYDYLRQNGMSKGSIHISMMDDCPCKDEDFMKALDEPSRKGQR